MKKQLLHLIFIIILLFTTVLLSKDPKAENKLKITFFGSSTCRKCYKIKKEILQPLAKDNPAAIELNIYDIDEEKDFQLMTEMEKAYKTTNSSSAELFLADTFLIGTKSIYQNSKSLIEDYLDKPQKWKLIQNNDSTTKDANYHQILKDKFNKFSFWAILAAGLADGVNPCAIATIIFLISFLATNKRKRSEILIIGMAFTTSVFFTYLLLGLGAFKLLTMLDSYRWLSDLIKWTAVALASAIAIYCFKDAYIYKKTGKTDNLKLKLPKSVKLRINKTISSNLKSSKIFYGALISGFLVSLLEAVCTGQVYLPTIILMTRHENLQLTGWLYLLFYNFLFVLPLLIIMILTSYGLTWHKLAKVTNNNLISLKIILGIIMLSLTGFLALAG